jgi:acylphosphatase
MRIVRLLITGRVQRVGYRAWAVDIARKLALRGWVRNRLDGAVEMLLAGPDGAVAAMIEAARRGPPAARVTRLCIADDEDDGSVGFTAQSTKQATTPLVEDEEPGRR